MTFPELRLALLRRARRPGRIGALLAGATLKVTPHGTGDLEVRLWGRRLRVPSNHHLPFIVGTNPFWSMSLVHCAAALSDPTLTVLDVGANVGDSAILLETYLRGVATLFALSPT